ncbi:MAG TPA: riboflavin synthase [Tepidisphaeraceae bacterium]|jgi:riboflavin synthase|nr:riboflavin synthase [Tepidisphaeraceae bacterium]
MFTGIVQDIVRLIGIAETPKFRRLTVAADYPDVRDGESIALNGCCLTVAELGRGEIGFDVITETLAKTNLGLLSIGDELNLERSLRAGDRIDGHFVQGHIDGRCPLIESISTDSEWRLKLQAPPHLARYLIPKGAVTLDGVSLTIAAIHGEHFEVALIPTTVRLTTLASRAAGWPFNLECDILSKTVVHYLETMRS